MRNSIRASLICAAAAVCAAGLAPACAAEPAAELSPLLADQEAGLRTSLAETAAVIVRAGEALQLRFPARLAFVPDRPELLPAAMTMLDLLARSLREYERTGIVVAVYTDVIGSAEYNQEQARARAAEVVAYLATRGISPARLVARGAGESSPLEAPNTPEGRELNRRLELTITPLSS